MLKIYAISSDLLVLEKADGILAVHAVVHCNNAGGSTVFMSLDQNEN